MSYPSIDILQKELAKQVFGDRKDTKKASGRALGTLLEVVSYYILQEWALTNNVVIELRIPEFGNPNITHNVEFALHPIKQNILPNIDFSSKPITTSKFIKSNKDLEHLFEKYKLRNVTILDKDSVQRNNTVIGTNESYKLILNFFKDKIHLCEILHAPFAMIECKRVGVEDGNKKGPTTIEKAKQGAYVAKVVSSLQKVRSRNGELLGFYESNDGDVSFLNFDEELRRLVYDAETEDMKGFVLTVGIVSNHGNWFSEDRLNKELLVLKDSYDWLLFMKDESMVEFVQDTITNPNRKEYKPIQKAFIDSYNKEISGNKFTKVNLYKDAHIALTQYFKENIERIESTWFNVITPTQSNVKDLKEILIHLKIKMDL